MQIPFYVIFVEEFRASWFFESQRSGWDVEMTSLLRALVALEEDQILFSVPKW